MRFWISEYLANHPLQKRIASWWIRKGLPVPEKIKRQLANQLHAEMIIRLMDIVVKEGSLTREKALEVHYEIGRELAEETKDMLNLDSNRVEDLSFIIDFLHNLLDISGKKNVGVQANEAISHWYNCPISTRLQELQSGGGPYYCHLYQEMYRGLLHTLNPRAFANKLTTTQSQGNTYCELKTWIN
jgi:predicted hydrocarbon binding protein